MRVLFLGTAGVNKKVFVERVANIAITTNRDVKPFLEVVDIDGEIKNRLGGSTGYAAFLDNPIPKERQDTWNAVFEDKVLKPFGAIPSRPPHVFLILHGIYFRDKDYFSHVNFSLLRKFQPSVVVTLIDDAYDVANEINKREEQVVTGSGCSFAEALEWRAVETMTGDMIANHLYVDPSEHEVDIRRLGSKGRALFRTPVPHFVVAVKHSPEMLYRLLFERWRLCAYFSHPITAIQTDPTKVDIINNAMRMLSADYTLFVPDTIDEFPVVKKADLSKKSRKTIRNLVVHEGKEHILIRRWPLKLDDTRPVAVLPGCVDLKSLLRLERVVKAHTERRDRRIIRQKLDAIIAYRPYWGGALSGGVDTEMAEAASRSIPIYALHVPKEDGKPDPIFRSFKAARCFTSLKKLQGQLIKRQETKAKQWQQEKRPNTWELD